MQYGRVIAEGDDGRGLITRLLGKVDRSKSADLRAHKIFKCNDTCPCKTILNCLLGIIRLPMKTCL
jgi:hypothetical protein